MSLSAVAAAIRALAKTRVMVGVPSDAEQPHLGSGNISTNARDDAGVAHPITNAELAYIHTYGAPEANIPARDGFHPGMASARPGIVLRLKDAAKAAIAGDSGGVDRNFHAAGLTAQSSIKSAIVEGLPPPLRPGTVAARRRRSKGSSYRRKAVSPSDVTPLVDTAQFLNSISYVLRKEK